MQNFSKFSRVMMGHGNAPLIMAALCIASILIFFQVINQHNMSTVKHARDICSSFPQGHGYVVDEYTNDNNEIGGFIVSSHSSTGASIHNIDAHGQRVAEIIPIPTFLQSPEGVSALAWQEKLMRNFPHKMSYQCDTQQ